MVDVKSAKKDAIVIDPKGDSRTKVVKILQGVYGQSNVFGFSPVQTSNYAEAIETNAKTLDLIVVANGDFLQNVLDIHRKYAIPTILRLDPGRPLNAEIAHRGNHGHYRYTTMLGIEEKAEMWAKYIAIAKSNAQKLRK